MSFKISALKAKTNSTPVVIKHPHTGEDLVDDQDNVAKIYLYGKASEQYRDFNDARLKKALEQQKIAKKITPPDLTVDKIRKDGIEFAVACSDRLEVITDDDGNEINTAEAFTKLYSDPEYYWLLDQVNAAIENDSNFF